MNKSIKKWITSLLCLCMVTSFFACGSDQGGSSSSGSEYGSESLTPEYTLSVSVDASNLASENARAYLSSPAGTSISDVIVGGAGRSDLGLATVFSHQSPADIEGGSLTIKEVGALEGITLSLTTNETDVYNLKTATEYEYRLVATTLLGGEMEESGRFTTEDTVRFMNVKSIVNTRDIGNRKTETGKTIKQGLLYRGSELDGLVESAYRLTEDGKRVMLDELKIRTLLDLRNPNKSAKDGGTLKAKDGVDRPSPLGETTNRIFFDAAQYDAIFSTDGKQKTKQVFVELAKKENYPIYLHCTYGCDRTGTIGLLLDGLLGCSEETAVQGYELSALYKDFPHINRKNAGVVNFFNRLTAVYSSAGKSYGARVEAYLLDCGVTAEEIASIREIFLGE